jgi:hypothetical protein
MRLAFPLLVACAVAGCTSPRGLDEAPMKLSPDEALAVRAQVDKARRAGAYTAAWNQAVDAGAGRERLETIAVEALAADDGDAKEMLHALRDKWGPLSPAARARVTSLSREAAGRGDWKLAVGIELVAADDPPAYAAAWRVYQDAPPQEASDLLARIREAREGTKD